MRKTAIVLISFFMFCVPAITWARGEALLEKYEIESLAVVDSDAGDSVINKDIHLKMLDGNEFLIQVSINVKKLEATFLFASGTTVVLSPVGKSAVFQTEGYQEYDDVDNSVKFMETYSTNECLINIIAWLIVPSPLDLIFLYFIVVTCF